MRPITECLQLSDKLTNLHDGVIECVCDANFKIKDGMQALVTSVQQVAKSSVLPSFTFQDQVFNPALYEGLTCSSTSTTLS